MVVTDTADIRSGCSAYQVKAHSREVLVQSNETAELQSLQTLATSGSLKKRKKKCVQPIYNDNISFLGTEKLKTIHSQEEVKQQCDVGSNKLTNSTMFF